MTHDWSKIYNPSYILPWQLLLLLWCQKLANNACILGNDAWLPWLQKQIQSLYLDSCTPIYSFKVRTLQWYLIFHLEVCNMNLLKKLKWVRPFFKKLNSSSLNDLINSCILEFGFTYISDVCSLECNILAIAVKRNCNVGPSSTWSSCYFFREKEIRSSNLENFN